jgi:hypothetical protein
VSSDGVAVCTQVYLRAQFGHGKSCSTVTARSLMGSNPPRNTIGDDPPKLCCSGERLWLRERLHLNAEEAAFSAAPSERFGLRECRAELDGVEDIEDAVPSDTRSTCELGQ